MDILNIPGRPLKMYKWILVKFSTHDNEYAPPIAPYHQYTSNILYRCYLFSRTDIPGILATIEVSNV